MKHARYKNKKVGIWGFGKTGQSVLAFVSPYAQEIFIFESQNLSDEQKQLAQLYNAIIISKECLPQFIELCDVIIPSPGVHLKPYAHLSEKFISELDIFAEQCTTKTIAITGSVGKTTVVTLLTELLNRCDIKSCVAGNIGTPMLNVIATQQQYEWIVLELSSFQLEHTKIFSPTIAVITNLFPNHLDRHETFINYAHAKAQIFARQIDHNARTLIPQKFLEVFTPFIKKQKIVLLTEDAYRHEISPALSDITFPENWNIIFAILKTIGLNLKLVKQHCSDLSIPEHRLELVRTYHDIAFYNDSKATIPEATLASLKALKNKRIILFLGGVSKGVDRIPFIQNLPTTLVHVICFGKEASNLYTLCQSHGIMSSSHPTLESGWEQCIQKMLPGDTVLFSPSGASFDLFKNYEERGSIFKKLVTDLS